ncbi:hypothetical protein [Absicoccus porci]|uniref:hypothetical protein n=1 Tax=Absicoccus porci TaxID=2486576 RepID=UPI00294232B0|nr:hypothetical protein [Absicoccus porci]
MIEIREPKFKAGERVIDKNGDVSTVINVNHYYFDKDEYWYNIEKDETIRLKPESKLEPYIEKPKSVWDLKEGDTYYSIYGDGNVSSEKKWFDDDYENNYRKIGNVFLTKEEAEFECERRKIETEMIRLGGRRKFNRGKDNYFIMYTRIEGLDYVNYQSMHEQGVIYFDSELDAINAVKTIGKDRIKKYIFRVES